MNVLKLLQMEPCKLRLGALEMMRLNQLDQLHGQESKRPIRTRVRLLQILQALKLSLIFPLLDLGDVQGKNYA
jgi:hypothetical protein